MLKVRVQFLMSVRLSVNLLCGFVHHSDDVTVADLVIMTKISHFKSSIDFTSQVFRVFLMCSYIPVYLISLAHISVSTKPF